MGRINNHLLIAERLDQFTDDHGEEGVFQVLGEDAYVRLEEARGLAMENGLTVSAIYDRLESDPSSWWALTENEEKALELWSQALVDMEKIVLVAQGKTVATDGAPPISGEMSLPVSVVALGGLAAAVGVFALLIG